MVRESDTRRSDVSLLEEEQDAAQYSGNENNDDNDKEHKIVV